MREHIEIFDLRFNSNILLFRDIKSLSKLLLAILLQEEKKGKPLDFTNAAFAEVLNRSQRQISRLLNDLKAKGYIDMQEIDFERIITVTEKTRKGGI